MSDKKRTYTVKTYYTTFITSTVEANNMDEAEVIAFDRRDDSVTPNGNVHPDIINNLESWYEADTIEEDND